MEMILVPKDQLMSIISECFRKEIAFAFQRDEKTGQEFLSASLVCKMFQPNISRGTLYNWQRAGKINSYLIGSKRLYKKSEVISSVEKIKRYKS